ncbi:undecaprenyl-diphosphate phosphatase [Modestobacter sp. I12A-02628]|uniref:Undecaprenyl-diphosphatase n=1 Tax=Goekera deserti TaxID=2497753 RepID=A0A7K3WF06_9ACTN|nr:undecaprenyl-diphosphate phosphatase [Goekera deserti]MPQ98514.1 undecaprenyl-diphosphate phosphatase [Goekera deserti]NDI48344.1 undecaprenyl-diphosphate phosphatase [Goekera deserti]NEL54093.1 undecaprenyl-diphosphate phosphatase [Goekera deserti]
MDVLQAVVLGVVEGLTEFLPVSSTGHLTIAEQLLGLQVDDAGVTAFTAIVQTGAILAVVLFFRADIGRLVAGLLRGLVSAEARRLPAWREAWVVVVGSVPIGVVGLLAQGLVSGPLRSLWVVAVALVAWSVVMVLAERHGRQDRGEGSVGVRDALVVGLVQCVALVPGVSRSGATISAGLVRGLDRVAATRLSFLLSVPALLAAGALEAVREGGAVSAGVGWGPTLLATAVSFVVGYASIAWLLRLVARYPITVFVGYRVGLGVLLAGLLTTGVLSAT